MPHFETREPISVTIELNVGGVHLIASDRPDTVVVVNPSDSGRKLDVDAAEHVDVDFSHGHLVVKVPKPRGLGIWGRPGSVDITVELPVNSHVQGEGGFADFHGDGQFGDVKIKNGAGGIRFDQAEGVSLVTGAGAVSLTRGVGHAEVTGAGDLRIGDIDGSAVVKNLNGKTWVGAVTGSLRIRSANGDITVGSALDDVVAKSANGNIEIGEVVSGSIVLETGSGGIDIGIGTGTAAWVDAITRFGRVHNSLDAASAPEPSHKSVEIRARTSFGNVVIHRSYGESEIPS